MGRDDYLDLFGNKLGELAVEKFLRFSARSRGDTGEIEGSIVWLARIDAWVTIVVRC